MKPPKPVAQQPMLLRALRQHRSLAKLGSGATERLAASATFERCEPGTVLWRSGESALHWTIILSGAVACLIQTVKPGITVLLDLYGPGEGIDDQTLLAGAVHAANARVLVPETLVARISRADLLRELERHPEAGVDFGVHASRQARCAEKRLAHFPAESAGRFASMVLELLARFGDWDEHGMDFLSLPIGPTDLASFVGVRQETAHRIWKDWTAKGWVREPGKGQPGFRVPDVASLAALARAEGIPVLLPQHGEEDLPEEITGVRLVAGANATASPAHSPQARVSH